MFQTEGTAFAKASERKQKQSPGAHSRGAGKPELTLRPREEGFKGGRALHGLCSMLSGQRSSMGSAGSGLGQK